MRTSLQGNAVARSRTVFGRDVVGVIFAYEAIQVAVGYFSEVLGCLGIKGPVRRLACWMATKWSMNPPPALTVERKRSS